MDNLTIERRAITDWEIKPQIKKEFKDRDIYLAYLKAESGRAKKIGRFGVLVEVYMGKHSCSKGEAIKLVADKHSELHGEYLRELKGGKIG